MTNEKRLELLLDYVKRTEPGAMSVYKNMFNPDSKPSDVMPIMSLLKVAADIRNEIAGKAATNGGQKGLMMLVKDIIKRAEKDGRTALSGIFTREAYEYATDGHRMIRFPSGLLPADAFPVCEGMKTVDLFGVASDSTEHDLPTVGKLKAAKAEGLDHEMYHIGAAAFNVNYLISAAQAGLDTVTIQGKNTPGFFTKKGEDTTLLICPMRQ